MKTSTLLLCVAALAAGCAQQPFTEGAQVARRVNDDLAPDARMRYDQVVILDRTLQNTKTGKLAVESQGARRNPTGTLRVIAQLRNRTDFTQAVEARVSFYDAGYAPIDRTSAWNRIILDANGVGVFEESSTLTSQVAHYLVEVREAR
jgi:hypothetical protein